MRQVLTALRLVSLLGPPLLGACWVDGSIQGGPYASEAGASSSGAAAVSGGAAHAGSGALGGHAGKSAGGMTNAAGSNGNAGSGSGAEQGGASNPPELPSAGSAGMSGGTPNGSGGSNASAGTSSGGASNQDCNAVGGGDCPSEGSLGCPGGMQCGCQLVSGLGQNKCALLQVGGDRYFLAAAMIETQNLDAASYPAGDVYPNGSPKTGDAYNAGVCKQNWGMMRECYGPWQANGQNDYMTALALRTDRGLDFRVYRACRDHFGQDWWAGHRNGMAGLENPNTQDIKNFKLAMDWTDQRLSGHEQDDLRFWVTLPAIAYLPPTPE